MLNGWCVSRVSVTAQCELGAREHLGKAQGGRHWCLPGWQARKRFMDQGFGISDPQPAQVAVSVRLQFINITRSIAC